MAAASKYTDIIVDVKDGIGTIKFNRPKQLNSFGGSLVNDTIAALRELDARDDTVFTVITGEGRFFCAGADVSNVGERHGGNWKNDGEKKVHYLTGFAQGMELIRSMIDHRKVLVLAMNGPGVGAGASWFQGTSDLFFAADDVWLQVTFSQLGLLPEMGSAVNWAHHVGPHRANGWLMLGEKASAQELREQGLVNKIFPKQGFHEAVHGYLVELLADRSGASMMEAKRLQNKATRDARVLALFEAVNALAERFVDGEPARRMAAKAKELVDKRNARQSKM